VYGPGSRWLQEMRTRAAGRIPTVIGSGRQELAPVFVDDVAAVLVAADDRDRLASGTWGLEGPDRVTADQLCDLLAGRARRKLHLSPRRAAAGRWSQGYGRAALEVLAMDSVADAPDAAVEFGVKPTPLADGLRRSFGLEGRIH
jgi:nucleoside-diphosphate-sugar epimerase